MSERLERHELNGFYPHTRVDVNDDGSVDVWVGTELLTVAELGEIVAFVETHGQVTVVEPE